MNEEIAREQVVDREHDRVGAADARIDEAETEYNSESARGYGRISSRFPFLSRAGAGFGFGFGFGFGTDFDTRIGFRTSRLDLLVIRDCDDRASTMPKSFGRPKGNKVPEGC